MSKEIILISPKSEWIHNDIPYPPLGIAQLLAVTKQNGIKVRFLDGQFSDFHSKLASLLKEDKTRLIGISSTLLQLPEGIRIAEKIKSSSSKSIIIMGGPGPECLGANNFFDQAGHCIDAVAHHEGEYTWLELANKFLSSNALEDKRLFFKGINGLSYFDNNKIITNPERGLVQNLDELPMPDWEGVNVQRYLNKWQENAGITSLSMMPSRGCPYNCVFCDKSIFGRTFRHHSPKRIVAEMETIKLRYDVDDIFFFDDNLTLDREVVLGVSEEILDRKLNLHWSLQARVDSVDQEMLNKMVEAGCTDIYFGIEAGTQDLLDYLNKGFTIEQAKQAIRMSAKAGIKPGAFFIVGIPGETKADIIALADMITETDLVYVGFSVLTPFPGTKLYSKTKHLITDEAKENYQSWDDTRSSVYKPKVFEVDPKKSISFLEDVFKKKLKDDSYEYDVSQFVINRFEDD